MPTDIPPYPLKHMIKLKINLCERGSPGACSANAAVTAKSKGQSSFGLWWERRAAYTWAQTVNKLEINPMDMVTAAHWQIFTNCLLQGNAIISGFMGLPEMGRAVNTALQPPGKRQIHEEFSVPTAGLCSSAAGRGGEREGAALPGREALLDNNCPLYTTPTQGNQTPTSPFPRWMNCPNHSASVSPRAPWTEDAEELLNTIEYLIHRRWLSALKISEGAAIGRH